MRTVLRLAALTLGLFLAARAIVEPFVIDVNNPATYADDWGGPSLAGVLAVHCGPGLVAAALMVAVVRRRRRGASAHP